MREIMDAIELEYRRYKKVAEGAFGQVTDQDLAVVPAPDGNSIAIVVWHLSGNLKSRFTDFLTSDGEKPWRNRESEFDSRPVSRPELLAKWDQGWSALFAALGGLDDGRSVTPVRS